jgi:hypothetical protein
MLSQCGPYDQVEHKLIQDWIHTDNNSYDLAIFGDVLEHLTPREIHTVINQILRKFNHIIIVIPLHDIFQDDAYGNDLEIHKTYVTANFFDRYNPVEKHIAFGKNWTIMNIHIFSKLPKEKFYKRLSFILFHRLMLTLQPLGLARPFVNFLKRHLIKYKWLLRS